MSQKYDIVIPASKRDVPFVCRVAQYIRKNLVEAEYIYVVTNKQNFNKKVFRNNKDPKLIALDENNLIEGLSFDSIKRILNERNYITTGPGWFLQQFIKLGFATTKYVREYYLTWDCDTLPLSHIQFFQESHPVFTIKKEYHKAYFETLHNLLGLDKEKDYSFIAEHMMFNSAIVREMLKKIENSNVDGNNWVEKCLYACNFNSLEAPHFSEFETYGTYVSKYYPDLYRTQKLNTFRGAGFIRGRYVTDAQLKKMSLDLDTASFEWYDMPAFPYNLPSLYYKYKAKFNKFKKSPAKALKRKIRKILF